MAAVGLLDLKVLGRGGVRVLGVLDREVDVRGVVGILRIAG